MLELMIVMTISLIVLAITIAKAQTTAQSIRLHESGTDYSNLLQQARIRAVRDDRYYTVLISTATTPPTAFVDIAGTGTYAASDPMIVLASDVAPQPYGSGPALSNLKSQFLPAGNSAQNSVNTTVAGPTFGPRGLPCTPSTNNGYTTCPYLTPTAYISFLQNTVSGQWEAITVTPAGRIRQWSYDTTSNWQPLD